MVRRDLEAEGGFAEFFARPGEGCRPRRAAAARWPGSAASPTGWASSTRRGGRLGGRCREAPSRGDAGGPAQAVDASAAARTAGPGRPSTQRRAGRTDSATVEARAGDRRGCRAGAPTDLRTARIERGRLDAAIRLRSARPRSTPAGRRGSSVTVRPVDTERARRRRSRRPSCPTRSRRRTAIRPADPATTRAARATRRRASRWLRGGHGTGYARGPASGSWRRRRRRRAERRAGRSTGERPADRRRTPRHDRRDRPTRDALGRGSDRWDRRGRATAGAAPDHASSVARIEPEPPPQPRGGSTIGPLRLGALAGVLRPDRRLPAPPLASTRGGMLVTAAPLIDIAPLERATMPGPRRRPVRQARRRDAQADQARPARARDARRDRRDAPADRARLRRLPRPRPAARGHPRGLRDAPGGRHRRRLPGREPGPDADAAEVAARRRLDDLVVEVAIIRPGPIQGNAVHPVPAPQAGPGAGDLPPPQPRAGPAGHARRDPLPGAGDEDRDRRRGLQRRPSRDGFRRAMGTWRSSREMEKLHARFVDGCIAPAGHDRGRSPRSCSGRSPAFAAFGFAKSHAAAFARTAYESSFLKLFYPAQFVVGLINAQPMGFYPVEVLVNDAKRHGVAGPAGRHQRVDATGRRPSGSGGRAGRWRSPATTARTTRPGRAAARGRGIERARAGALVGLRHPARAARERWAAESADGLGRPARAAPRQGDRRGARGAARRGARARGRTRALADVVERTGLPEEMIERLIRVGGAGLARAAAARAALAAARGRGRDARARRRARDPTAGRHAGRGTADGPAPARDRCARRCRRSTEPERLGDAYAVVGLDARRQVVELFRPALDRLGAVDERGARGSRAGTGPDRRPGRDPPAPDDRARARSSWPSRTRPGWSTSRSGRTPGRGCAASSGATRCSSSTATSSASRRS